MAIDLAGYKFGTDTGQAVHGALVAPAFDTVETINHFYGVIGAAVNYSKPSTRVLTLEVTFLNFTTEATLRTAVATVQSKVATNGKLVVDGIDWPSCAFLAFDPAGPPLRDGSGKHGWLQIGTLKFRSISF